MKWGLSIALALAACLTAGPRLRAQAPAGSDAASSGQSKPSDSGQKPDSQQPGANPFPEDTSSVPLMPSRSTPALPEGTNDGAASAGIPLPAEDMDPVRSPDDPAPAADAAQGTDSSSSTQGLDRLLPPPNADEDKPERKRKLAVKEPTHQEAASKDLEVGGYYLQTRNWKAALSRFESALVLDPENPEVYWGLAEAQHHLGDYASARANYLKLLDYDPDGPHGKEARKELKDPAIAKAQNAAPAAPAADAPK